jgi:hypothetical protein
MEAKVHAIPSKPRHNHFERLATDFGVACAGFNEFSNLRPACPHQRVDSLNLVQNQGFFDRKELVTSGATELENLYHKARLFN